MIKKTLFGLLAVITACGMLAAGVFAQETPEEAAGEPAPIVEEAEAPEEAKEEVEPVPAVEEAEAAEVEEAAEAEPASAVEEAVEEAEEATEEETADPIEGSWILDSVYEIKDGADPVLLAKEENQSFYGSGIGIYTFENGGYSHYNMIDGGGNLDEDASWESIEQDVYSITESIGTITMKYEKKEDVLQRIIEDENQTLVFVYVRALIGSWKLDRVLEIHDGDAPDELTKEENQSLYAEDGNILTFLMDGKAIEEVKDGPNASVTEGTWEMTDPDYYVYTEDTMEMEFFYFRVDDTLLRDVKDDAPDALHPYLQFIYVRAENEEAADEETVEEEAVEEEAAGEEPAEEEATEEETADEEPAEEEATEEETAGEEPAEEEATGEEAAEEETAGEEPAEEETAGEEPAEEETAEEETGEEDAEAAPAAGTTETMYCISDVGVNIRDDGSLDGEIIGGIEYGYAVTVTGIAEDPDWLVIDYDGQTGYVYKENFSDEEPPAEPVTEPEPMDEEDLNADGETFFEDTIYLYDPEGSDAQIEVLELNKIGWIDLDTGVIYIQEIGGGYHFYGNDGSVWVTEAYFNENPVDSSGLDD